MVNGPIGEHSLAFRGVMPWHHGLRVQNVFAGTLTAGTLVYVSGTSTDPARGADIIPKATKADADAAAPANVATYVVTEDIPQNGYGVVAKYFVQRGVDTSAYTTVGDPAYLSTTAGATTPTRPTAANATKQRVGYCVKKDASTGILCFDLLANGVESYGSGSVDGLSGTNLGIVADQAAGAVSAANFGVPVTVRLTVPAGATGNVDFTGWPFKMRVSSVSALKTSANGGAGDAVRVANGATTDWITNSLDLNVLDAAVVNATSLDDARIDIASGATVRVARTQATNAACVVVVTGVRVA